MRIFLPSTLTSLADILAQGKVHSTDAFAVPREFREAEQADEEELEYEALQRAAEASLRLLAAAPGVPRRRVVLAAEVPERIVDRPGGPEVDPAAVTVAGEVPLKRVVSAHIDDEAAAADIGAAVTEPGAGHEDEHELMWYATQELKYLVE